MKNLFFVLSMLAASTALAGNHPPKDPPATTPDQTAVGVGVGLGVGLGVGVADAQSDASAQSDATATSDSAATAYGGSASAGQTQSQSQVAFGGSSSAQSEGSSADSSADNSLSLTQNYRAVRNAPSVALGSVFPTASCKGGFGIGGSGINGSGLLNFSTTDKECQTFLLAQHFLTLGMPDVSCRLLLTTKTFERSGLSGVDCSPAPAPTQPQLAVADLPLDPRYVTREELAERDRRMITTMSGK